MGPSGARSDQPLRIIQAYRRVPVAYVKKDEAVPDELVYALNERFAGKQVKVLGIDYGD